MTNAWSMPLYANKPRRKIPGTDCVAVTMYRSGDNSLREYSIFSSDGEAWLGRAYYHGPRWPRTRCYTMESIYWPSKESWRTLSEFAAEMARRNGLDNLIEK